MIGVVPLARRNLTRQRLRFALSAAGVGLALLLILALDAIYSGVLRQVTAYPDHAGAPVIVSQRGVQTMHMSRAPPCPSDWCGRCGATRAWPAPHRSSTPPSSSMAESRLELFDRLSEGGRAVEDELRTGAAGTTRDRDRQDHGEPTRGGHRRPAAHRRWAPADRRPDRGHVQHHQLGLVHRLPNVRAARGGRRSRQLRPRLAAAGSFARCPRGPPAEGLSVTGRPARNSRRTSGMSYPT